MGIWLCLVTHEIHFALSRKWRFPRKCSSEFSSSLISFDIDHGYGALRPFFCSVDVHFHFLHDFKVLHSRVIGLRNFCQFRKRVMMELGESCDAFNGSSSGGYNKSLCSYNDKVFGCSIVSWGWNYVMKSSNYQLTCLIPKQLGLRLEWWSWNLTKILELAMNYVNLTSGECSNVLAWNELC